MFKWLQKECSNYNFLRTCQLLHATLSKASRFFIVMLKIVFKLKLKLRRCPKWTIKLPKNSEGRKMVPYHAWPSKGYAAHLYFSRILQTGQRGSEVRSATVGCTLETLDHTSLPFRHLRHEQFDCSSQTNPFVHVWSLRSIFGFACFRLGTFVCIKSIQTAATEPPVYSPCLLARSLGRLLRMKKRMITGCDLWKACSRLSYRFLDSSFAAARAQSASYRGMTRCICGALRRSVSVVCGVIIC